MPNNTSAPIGLSSDVLDYKLEDDDTELGGIDHPGETVREFLESITDEWEKYFTSIDDLNSALRQLGIKPIPKKD